MAIYYDDTAQEFAVSPDECPDCGEPRYDTGCDAPGCSGAAFPCCGTGCDIELEDSECQAALDDEDDEECEERIERERAAVGLAGDDDEPLVSATYFDELAEVAGGNHAEPEIDAVLAKRPTHDEVAAVDEETEPVEPVAEGEAS